MKATELMIDDWVKSRGKIEQVREVYDGFICTDSFEDSHDYYFDPIPLSGRILKRSGFKSGEYDDGYTWYKGDPRTGISQEVSLAQDEKGWMVNLFSPKTGMEIEELNLSYVHELQHAIRLLGIDLEITVV